MSRRVSAFLIALALPCLYAANVAPAAYANHTTRVNELQKTGVDPWLMALSMGGIVFLLIVFAVIVLFWEHNDRLEEGGESAASRVDEPDTELARADAKSG